MILGDGFSVLLFFHSVKMTYMAVTVDLLKLDTYLLIDNYSADMRLKEICLIYDEYSSSYLRKNEVSNLSKGAIIFYRLSVGRPEFFWGGQREGPVFYAKGGPEKIGNWRSQTDGPPPGKK